MILFVVDSCESLSKDKDIPELKAVHRIRSKVFYSNKWLQSKTYKLWLKAATENFNDVILLSIIFSDKKSCWFPLKWKKCSVHYQNVGNIRLFCLAHNNLIALPNLR